MSICEKIKEFILLFRPKDWPRSWGPLIFGAFVATKGALNPLTLLLGAFVFAPLLWGSLYAINDITDIREDKKLHKFKPIIRGAITLKEAKIVSIIVLFLAMIFSYLINLNFFIVVMLTVITEFLYTLKPFRFRDRPILDIFFGGCFSGVYRFLAGFFLFPSSSSLPWLIITFVAVVQIAVYFTYKQHAKDKKVKNTTYYLSYKQATAITGVLMAVALVLVICAAIIPICCPRLLYLGILPVYVLWLLPLNLLTLPFYKRLFSKKISSGLIRHVKLITSLHYFANFLLMGLAFYI